MDDLAEMLADVADERHRQDELWGQQDHPDGTGGGTSKLCELIAKDACEAAAKDGTLTYALILHEEAAEVLACEDKGKLDIELTQLAAVCIAWREKLRRGL